MANSRKDRAASKKYIDTHIGRRYTVTLRHDGGTVNITTFASDIIEAIKMVCNADRAPLRSVVAVKVAK